MKRNIPPDPALKWLFENDPEARRGSRESYAQRHGILTANKRRSISHHETTFSDLSASNAVRLGLTEPDDE